MPVYKGFDFGRYLEMLKWPLYDTVGVKLGEIVETEELVGKKRRKTQQLAAAFLVPLGQRDESGRAKSWVQTSLHMPNLLPNPQRFNVVAVHCAFWRRSGSFLPLDHPLWRESVVDFRVGDAQKPYWRSPAWLCAHPFVLAAEIQKCGIPGKPFFELEKLFANRLDIENPVDGSYGGVTINQGEYFGVMVDINPAVVAKPEQWDDLVCFVELAGTLCRPVQ